MKKMLLTSIALGALISACGGPRPVTASESRQVSWVENYSSAEVMLKATGVAEDRDEAILDLRKAALWYLLEGGTDPLLNSPEAKMKFKPYMDSVYGNPMRYITWEAADVDQMLKVQLGNGEKGWKMTKHLRVSRQMLVDFLERKNVIPSKEKLAEQEGLPMIMVIPDAPKGQTPLSVFDSNPLAKHAAATIESYLTARKYDVLVPKQMAQLNQIVDLSADAKQIENDEAYQIALSIGSDVYFTFAGQVEKNKASVQVKAFETTTGKLLGTETGYSQMRPGANSEPLVEEAVNNALVNVIQRVNQYWADDSKRGLQYKVILRVKGKFSEDQILSIQDEVDQVIKLKFNQKKANVITDQTMDYQIWVDRNMYSDAAEVERAFRTGVKDAKIRRISMNKKLLILSVDHP